MKEQELERRLAEALSRAAPDDLDGVLSRCETRKGAVIPMKKTISKAWTAAAAACLALALVCGGWLYTWRQANTVASVVSLDVNPSIELSVNEKERVLSCTALNDDASKVLADMDGGADLEGTKLDVAVNAVVGALVRNGYLDSVSSAILISVEDRDQDRAQRLQQELVASVDQALQGSSTEILSQVLTDVAPAAEEPTAAFRQKYASISRGKMSLVYKVMQMNGTLAMDSTTILDQLCALSVEELNDLLENEVMDIPVGKSAACDAAQEYAGVLEVNSVTCDVDPEFNGSRPHYEVELNWLGAGQEYDYLVDAFTGEVYSGRRNILSGGSGETSATASTPAQIISAAEAFDAAAAYHIARYPELSGYNYLDIKTELDDGGAYYEVEFVCNTREFEYRVDARTGDILKEDTDYPGVSAKSETPSQQYIGRDTAVQAAMIHAGVTYSDSMPLTFQYDWDDGVLRYDIEFWTGGYEYHYEIDAATGAVLDWEKEIDDKGVIGVADGPTAIYTADCTADEAKAAAFRHAGCAEADASYCTVQLDQDDGCYKVEFCWYGNAYEYEISCGDCSILDWDSEVCSHHNHARHDQTGGHHGGHHG